MSDFDFDDIEKILLKAGLNEDQMIRFSKNKLSRTYFKEINLYPQQIEAGKALQKSLEKHNVVCLAAKTQVGKTGTTISLAKDLIHKGVSIENIFVISGLNDREWKKQTQDRFPKEFMNQIYKRDELLKHFSPKVKGLKNLYIIIDEVQYASKKNQTTDKMFTELGWTPKYLKENNIKIIEVSATPNGNIYDLKKDEWKDVVDIVFMSDGKGYVSLKSLYDSGQIKQYQDLYCWDINKNKCKDIKSLIHAIKELEKDIQSFDEPRYHIIRVGTSTKLAIVKQNFEKYFNNEYRYVEVSSLSADEDDINKILTMPPKTHKIIFVLQKYRCSKTLNKKYIGVLYEQYTVNKDFSVVIQGLAGRITGYDKHDCICYTDIPILHTYEELWESKFHSRVKWSTSTSTYSKSKGETVSKLTFNCRNDNANKSNEEREPIIKKFKTQEAAKRYYNKRLKSVFGGRGPQKRKPNSKGFYVTTIGRKRGTDVYSCDEIYEVRKWSLNHDHKLTFHPCYEDKNDKSTLQFWMIYYEPDIA